MSNVSYHNVSQLKEDPGLEYIDGDFDAQIVVEDVVIRLIIPLLRLEMSCQSAPCKRGKGCTDDERVLGEILEEAARLAALKEEVERPHGRSERREGREGEQPMHRCASERGAAFRG